MRTRWTIVAIVCGVLLLSAGVASAALREDAGTVADPDGLVPLVDETSASPTQPDPSPDPSETPSESPSLSPDATEPGEDPEARDNHGAAVSEVARDKDAVGSKTLKNGKTVTNHGQAVSEVARDKGAAEAKSGDAGGNGQSKAKGHDKEK